MRWAHRSRQSRLSDESEEGTRLRPESGAHLLLVLSSRRRLVESILLTNMVGFDAQGRLRRYESPLDILREFCEVRLQFYQKRKVRSRLLPPPFPPLPLAYPRLRMPLRLLVSIRVITTRSVTNEGATQRWLRRGTRSTYKRDHSSEEIPSRAVGTDDY